MHAKPKSPKMETLSKPSGTQAKSNDTLLVCFLSKNTVIYIYNCFSQKQLYIHIYKTHSKTCKDSNRKNMKRKPKCMQNQNQQNGNTQQTIEHKQNQMIHL